MSDSAASLHVEGLVCGYGRSTVLHGVTLDVPAGQIVTLIGANGAGKSTTLAAISGLIPASSGRIVLDSTLDLRGVSPDAIVANGVIQVPERRQLFASMTVDENLLLGAFKVRSSAEIRARLERCYALFPRLRERRTQVARSMSGGEQQMVAIARAMMARPRLLILDEPSLGLAPKIVGQVLDLIRQLRQEGCTILLVEQNARAALEIADRAYVMSTGRIVREGAAAEMVADPAIQAAYLGNETADSGSMEERIRALVRARPNPFAQVRSP